MGLSVIQFTECALGGELEVVCPCCDVYHIFTPHGLYPSGSCDTPTYIGTIIRTGPSFSGHCEDLWEMCCCPDPCTGQACSPDGDWSQGHYELPPDATIVDVNVFLGEPPEIDCGKSLCTPSMECPLEEDPDAPDPCDDASFECDSCPKLPNSQTCPVNCICGCAYNSTMEVCEDDPDLGPPFFIGGEYGGAQVTHYRSETTNILFPDSNIIDGEFSATLDLCTCYGWDGPSYRRQGCFTAYNGTPYYHKCPGYILNWQICVISKHVIVNDYGEYEIYTSPCQSGVVGATIVCYDYETRQEKNALYDFSWPEVSVSVNLGPFGSILKDYTGSCTTGAATYEQYNTGGTLVSSVSSSITISGGGPSDDCSGEDICDDYSG